MNVDLNQTVTGDFQIGACLASLAGDLRVGFAPEGVSRTPSMI
jgi:hypothetical protein